MPELPEVETIKKVLQKKLLNFEITDVKILNEKLRWPIEKQVKKFAEKTKIIKFCRIGKFIILKTNINTCIIFHFGMSGFIKISGKDQSKHKHDHLKLIAMDKNKKKLFVIYNDVRKFGYIGCCKEENLKNHFLLKNLGLEPLSKKLDNKYLLKKFKKMNTTIKSALLNQKLIAGIGNIYASEILFSAKIHPLFHVGLINEFQASQLIYSIKMILRKAIKLGGTSIKDYKKPNGRLGYFTNELSVYLRTGDNCFNCGVKIKMLVIAGRSTFFCGKCQSLKQ